MTPPNKDAAARVRASFGRQHAMALLGAQMTEVEAGPTEIVLPFREELTQQHGFVHAGIITTIVDSACGYAALSLMPPEVGVLTIELSQSAESCGGRAFCRAWTRGETWANVHGVYW